MMKNYLQLMLEKRATFKTLESSFRLIPTVNQDVFSIGKSNEYSGELTENIVSKSALPKLITGLFFFMTLVGFNQKIISQVIISEVAPWSSSTSISADWFEVTNNGNTNVDISGWKMDDNSNLFTKAVPISGITSIAPGESVILLETSATNAATVIENFKSVWFNGNPPANLQIGTYTGSGVGLGGSGDAVNLFDINGTLQANVAFGASSSTAPFATFDNAQGLNNATISLLSVVGTNGAFLAANDNTQIGSPGKISGSLNIETIEKSSLKLYPNPVNDILNISYPEEMTKLSLLNILGQEVLSKNVNSKDVTIDMSGLTKGTYFVKVSVSTNQNCKTMKIVKL